MADRWTPIAIDGDPVAMLDAAQRLTAEAVAESGVGGERLIGVGVGFAAPVDAVTGRVLTGGIMPGWDGVDPAEELEKRLGMPVQVENDANAGAIGEHMFGAGRGVADMIYLQLSAGIGLGLIMAGRPYRGAGGIAGEIGHVRVVDNGLICRCGNRGCLETVASPDVVVELLERSRGERLTMAQVMELRARGRSRRRAGGRRRRQGDRARDRGHREPAQPAAGRDRRRSLAGRRRAAGPDPRRDRRGLARARRDGGHGRRRGLGERAEVLGAAEHPAHARARKRSRAASPARPDRSGEGFVRPTAHH